MRVSPLSVSVLHRRSLSADRDHLVAAMRQTETRASTQALVRELAEKLDIYGRPTHYRRGLGPIGGLGTLASMRHDGEAVEPGPRALIGNSLATALIDMASSARPSAHFFGNELVAVDRGTACREPYFIATMLVESVGGTGALPRPEGAWARRSAHGGLRRRRGLARRQLVSCGSTVAANRAAEPGRPALRSVARRWSW